MREEAIMHNILSNIVGEFGHEYVCEESELYLLLKFLKWLVKTNRIKLVAPTYVAKPDLFKDFK